MRFAKPFKIEYKLNNTKHFDSIKVYFMFRSQAFRCLLVTCTCFPMLASAEAPSNLHIHVVKPHMTLPSVASTNGVADELMQVNQKANTASNRFPPIKSRLTFAASVDPLSSDSKGKTKASEGAISFLERVFDENISKAYIVETAVFLNPWAVLYGSLSKNDLQHLSLVLGNYKSSPVYLSLGKLSIPFGTGDTVGFDGSPLGKLGEAKNIWSMALGWTPFIKDPAHILKVMPFATLNQSSNWGYPAGVNVQYTYQIPQWTLSGGAAYINRLSLLDSKECLNVYAKVNFDKLVTLKAEIVLGLKKGLKQTQTSMKNKFSTTSQEPFLLCVEGDIHFPVANYKSSVFLGWGTGTTSKDPALNRVFGGMKLEASKSTNLAIEYVQGLDSSFISDKTELLNSLKVHVAYSLAE